MVVIKRMYVFNMRLLSLTEFNISITKLEYVKYKQTLHCFLVMS